MFLLLGNDNEDITIAWENHLIVNEYKFFIRKV